ncbi:hypothetical protein PENSPDRAFT_694574, partial [Peniophora sp. CONT]
GAAPTPGAAGSSSSGAAPTSGATGSPSGGGAPTPGATGSSSGPTGGSAPTSGSSFAPGSSTAPGATPRDEQTGGAPSSDGGTPSFNRQVLQEFGDSLLLGISNLANSLMTRLEEGALSFNANLTSIHQGIAGLKEQVDAQSGYQGGSRGPGKKKQENVVDDGTAVFDPNRKTTGKPTNVDPQGLVPKKLVRKHLQALFDAQGQGKYGPVAPLDVVLHVNEYVQAQTNGKKRLRQNFRFDIPPGTTAQTLAIDYNFAGPKTSGYNQLMAQCFALDFLANVDSDLSYEQVRDLYFNRIKTLKADRNRDLRLEAYAAQTGASKEVIEARRVEQQNAEQRRRALFHRRRDVGDSLQAAGADPKGHVGAFVRAIGVDGTSDDEADWIASSSQPAVKKKKRIVIPLFWRHPHCRVIMCRLDDLHEWTQGKYAIGSVERRGAAVEPRFFYEDREPDKDAEPVVGLPINIYNPEWTALAGSTYMRTTVQPRNTAFVVPPEFDLYYQTMSDRWAEHTASRVRKGKARAV